MASCSDREAAQRLADEVRRLRDENSRLRKERNEWRLIARERSKELQTLSDKLCKLKDGESL